MIEILEKSDCLGPHLPRCQNYLHLCGDFLSFNRRYQNTEFLFSKGFLYSLPWHVFYLLARLGEGTEIEGYHKRCCHCENRQSSKQTFASCDSFNLGFETHTAAGVQLEVSNVILDPNSQNALSLVTGPPRTDHHITIVLHLSSMAGEGGTVLRWEGWFGHRSNIYWLYDHEKVMFLFLWSLFMIFVSH